MLPRLRLHLPLPGTLPGMLPGTLPGTLLSALLTCPVPAQLPPMPAPIENPGTPEKVLLGKFLFWEEQLSSNDSIACGTCHLPEAGGSDPRMPFALEPGLDGVFGTADDVRGSAGVVRHGPNLDFARSQRFGFDRQVTARWSPTNLGAGHQSRLFWDARADGVFVDPEGGAVLIPSGGALEHQSVLPIVESREMANEARTWQDVRQKLQNATPMRLASDLPADMAQALQTHGSYPALFQAAFGDPAIDAGRIGFALAAYQRTLNPDQTPWDAFIAGNTNALSPDEQQGWNLFRGIAQCASCHAPPLFADDTPHNLGLRPAAEDPGAGGISGVPAEQGAFKTPTLRNAGLRTRLFHNGQSPALGHPDQLTLQGSVLNVYLNGGGTDPSNLDPLLVPLAQLNLGPPDVQQILAFVAAGLTDVRARDGLPPFDHPTLRSTALPPPQRYRQGAAGAIEPFLIDTVPPFPGNLDYRLGLVGGDGIAPALLTFGFRPSQPGLSFGGLPWHVEVFGWIPTTLHAPTGEPGLATLALPLPPALAQQPLPIYLQLFVADPLATSSIGIASSQGYELVIR